MGGFRTKEQVKNRSIYVIYIPIWVDLERIIAPGNITFIPYLHSNMGGFRTMPHENKAVTKL